MSKKLEFDIVDVFTAKAYAGNAAAVVIGADGQDAERLQAIAAEFRQSATVFVLASDSPDASVRFRCFTPTSEQRLCGHGMLAGVHTLLERGRFASMLTDPKISLPVQTAVGTLRLQCESAESLPSGRLLWLALPRPQFTSRSLNVGQLADWLGIDVESIDTALPIMETQDEDLLIFVRSYVALNEAQPQFTALGAWCARHRIRGVCLSTLNTLAPSIHVQSRFFAPAAGVNEDPVTGSVHGPLSAYLVAHELVPHSGGAAAVTGVQAEAGGRAGLIRAIVQQEVGVGFSVRIAGECHTTMRGTLLG